jgi:hypothetical protein
MNLAGSADASPLLEALGEAARLLEAGDPEGAAEAMALVAGRCSAVSANGLTAQEIEEARQLLERCRAAEPPMRRKLNDEMQRLSTSNRAHSVYQR